MKLLALEADQPEFRTVHFRGGLSLILGDSPGDAVEGSSNGVGKTLALGLVHHCLGGKADPRLARAVPDWVFRLRFQLEDGEHLIERSGNGRGITWNEEPLRIGQLRERLNAVGPFGLANAPAGVTFRSLLSRFARHTPEDCQDPVRTRREQESDALLRVAFLLGLDTTLI